jgi:hypothetical protein
MLQVAAYDSTTDGLRHIRRVQQLLNECVRRLLERADVHDESKLKEPEKSAFDRVVPRLKAATFGSDAYRAALADLGPALSHHYEANSHHPEHYVDGINGMDLFDVLEMLMDWRAACEGHGSHCLSFTHLVDRFHIEPQFAAVLVNTIEAFQWDYR